MSPDCSLIIPAFNAEKTIHNTLGSIELDKKWHYRVEIIIIDDGSVDNTRRIISDYAEKYNQIKVINESNRGVSCARNKGIMEASGKYIFFMDADDSLSRITLESIIQIAETTNADIIVSDYCVNDIHRNQRNKISCKIPYNKLLCGDYLIEVWKRFFVNDTAGLTNLWNKLFRRSIILDNEISFDERRTHGEDWAFCIQYLQHVQSLYAIDEAVYDYHIDGSQMRSKYKKELAYCLIDGDRIVSEINDRYLHFEKNSDEYLENKKLFYYQIIDFLRMDFPPNEKRAFLKNPEVRACFSYLKSLNKIKLTNADLSRKDIIACELLLIGQYKPVIKRIFR